MSVKKLMQGRRSFSFPCAAAIAVGAGAFLWLFAFPSTARAWGANAERLVAGKAVDTLPPDIRGFFEANRDFFTRHVTDPLDLLAKSPDAERRNHYLYLDRYGKFPFDALPQDYKAAVAKFSKSKLEASGVLPWQIGVYSQKLTAAMRNHDWEEARADAATLAAYVAQAHDPFHTTENFDGHLSNQTGVDARFGSNLIDRFSTFFPMRPNDASFLRDPTDHAFDDCMSAHASVESILLADRRAREGLSDFTDDYYARFYNLAGAILIRQLSDAASDVGSYWLTAWINAGRPQLPPQ
ncbi:MAG: hypothetical protein LAO19_13325 [Acidobacteriia bacterium]|nr:hypothetical protein [Terriglobia bacterium]